MSSESPTKVDLGDVDPTVAHIPCLECQQKISCPVELSMVAMPQDDTRITRVGARARIDTAPMWAHYFELHGPPDPFDDAGAAGRNGA
jgi:hypothetical protein